jgi:hypothetical protein
MWAGSKVGVWRIVVWSALASLAFLSHVSTFALLLGTLLTLAVLYLVPLAPGLRPAGKGILLATAIALVFSTITYYGHFTDVYRGALRVRQTTGATPAATVPSTSSSASEGVESSSFASRVVSALRLTLESAGWPICLLAILGAWRLRSNHVYSALGLALAAWGIAFVVFLGVALMRVDVQYERYSLEFVGRVVYATSPAIVILAAYGAMWGWRANLVSRFASAALVAIALVMGTRAWMQW